MNERPHSMTPLAHPQSFTYLVQWRWWLPLFVFPALSVFVGMPTRVTCEALWLCCSWETHTETFWLFSDAVSNIISNTFTEWNALFLSAAQNSPFITLKSVSRLPVPDYYLQTAQQRTWADQLSSKFLQGLQYLIEKCPRSQWVTKIKFCRMRWNKRAHNFAESI